MDGDPPPQPRKRRQKYSKLICHGCRARRIRCILPDTTIAASPSPQPPKKACQRCQQHGLECIVDSTTLGRPNRQQPSMVREASATGSSSIPGNPQNEPTIEEDELDFEGFVLSQLDDEDLDGQAAASNRRPSRAEMSDALFTPFALFASLLSRDRKFGKALSVPPIPTKSVLDIVTSDLASALDHRLVWHRLHCPEVPSLPALRAELMTFDPAHSHHLVNSFFLALLCDLAIDVPLKDAGMYQHLHSDLQSILFHGGHQLLFTLPKHPSTILSLHLVAAFKPLLLISTQSAAPNAIKAAPYVSLAYQVAHDLDYDEAGLDLLEALQARPDRDTASRVEVLVNRCIQWLWLWLAKDITGGRSLLGNPPARYRRQDPSIDECVEALNAAAAAGVIPHRSLLACSLAIFGVDRIKYTREAVHHWRDLQMLGQLIDGQRVACEEHKERLIKALAQHFDDEYYTVILQLFDLHLLTTTGHIQGQALFFAIMSGALAAHQQYVQPDDALGVSKNIIQTLLAHDENDPDRPTHRKFLEKYGTDRLDVLQRHLSDFISACDTLKLRDVPYIGMTRQSVAMVLYTCKEIVETNAAKLKGWEGVDDNIDVQMILFSESARALEGMRYGAGTGEAMAQGCLLTATAKMVRSLQGILGAFKKTAGEVRVRDGRHDGARVADEAPVEQAMVDGEGLHGDAAVNAGLQDWEMMLDNPFADWGNWPQFNPMDFSDLFGEGFDWNLDPPAT